MKIRTNNQPQGSAILVTLLTGFVVGMVLASYLTMVSVQNQSTMRSLSWNSCIPSTEAGVEEALTAVHAYGTTNLTSGGWVKNTTDGLYHKTGDLGNGYTYEVGIRPPSVGSPDQPTIEALGYAPAPANLATSYQSPYAMILGGLIPTYTPSGLQAKRKILVNCARQTPMQYAMLAKYKIDLNGNNISTDSFDSTDPNWSIGGMYSSTLTKDKGDIATNLGLVDSVNIGNADIRGHVKTGPGGSVAVGSNGGVGDKTWVTSTNGIKPGWVSDDCNIDIPAVKQPFNGAPKPNGGQYLGTGPTYDYILGSGNWKIQDFSGKVLVTGDAVLLVTSSFSFSGSDGITILPGTSLQVYVAPATASLGGNGIQNPGDAMSFIYYGLDSNTSLSFGGNSSFTGTIYAPNADFKLGGSGSGEYDFVGASVTKTVTMTGHFHFHYDESLARRFPIALYVVNGWHEMNPNTN
jgi:hypothetical protein